MTGAGGGSVVPCHKSCCRPFQGRLPTVGCLIWCMTSYDVDAIIPGSFMSLGQLARFLLRKARLLFAFLDVVSTCAFQVKLSAMVTHRYLPVLFTVRL